MDGTQVKDQSPADTGYKSHQLSRRMKFTCDILQNKNGTFTLFYAEDRVFKEE